MSPVALNSAPAPTAPALMSPAATPNGQADSPLAAAWRHWEALGGEAGPRDGGLPRRADFDPLAVPRLLPYLSMLSIEGTDFRYRLMGSQASYALGLDMTGRLLSEMPMASLRAPLASLLARARDGAAPASHELIRPWPSLARAELLALPLSHEEGRGADRILLAESYSFEPGRERVLLAEHETGLAGASDSGAALYRPLRRRLAAA